MSKICCYTITRNSVVIANYLMMNLNISNKYFIFCPEIRKLVFDLFYLMNPYTYI